MNVVVSAGGRFHAHHLAHQLLRRNSLSGFFTFDYTRHDMAIVPSALVHVAKTCKFLNDAFVCFHGARFINKTRFNHFKDNLFDSFVAKKLETLELFDLFVGWAHYSLKAMAVAKQRGAHVIIESGSCHIATQETILQREYDRWNISYQPIYAPIKEKMLTEYEQADYIMTLSTFARKSFIDQGFSVQKILMVPCGVDVAYFSQMPINHAKRKKKFRVICVGLITLRKGIQDLIQAWHQAQLPLDITELVIIGALQHDFMQIKHRLPIASNVVFTGPQDRATLRDYYHQSSLFILPSLEEGFGMVIGEAMASGLPVICTTNSAAPDLIEHGKHGFLVPPSNIDSLTQFLTWCFENQEAAATLGIVGKKHIMQWSWERYGKHVYSTYQNIL